LVKDDFIFTILADTSVSLLFINTRIERIKEIFFQIYEQLGICFGRSVEKYIPKFEEKTGQIARYLNL
jgi:hypothetical protein